MVESTYDLDYPKLKLNQHKEVHSPVEIQVDINYDFDLLYWQSEGKELKNVTWLSGK